jgi:hypothetical protein
MTPSVRARKIAIGERLISLVLPLFRDNTT